MVVETMTLNMALDVALNCCFLDVPFKTDNRILTPIMENIDFPKINWDMMGSTVRKKLIHLKDLRFL